MWLRVLGLNKPMHPRNKPELTHARMINGTCPQGPDSIYMTQISCFTSTKNPLVRHDGRVIFLFAQCDILSPPDDIFIYKDVILPVQEIPFGRQDGRKIFLSDIFMTSLFIVKILFCQ